MIKYKGMINVLKTSEKIMKSNNEEYRCYMASSSFIYVRLYFKKGNKIEEKGTKYAKMIYLI